MEPEVWTTLGTGIVYLEDTARCPFVIPRGSTGWNQTKPMEASSKAGVLEKNNFFPFLFLSRPNISQAPSCFALVFHLFCSCTISDQLYSNWIADKNLDGFASMFVVLLAKRRSLRQHHAGQGVYLCLAMSPMKHTFPPRPDFFFNPVVLELICYCTRANWLKYESNTTGRLLKNWTGASLLRNMILSNGKQKMNTSQFSTLKHIYLQGC